MILDIDQMSRQWEEQIPKGYKVIKRLHRGTFRGDYMLLAEKDEVTALIGFDGISETPIFIETYHELPVDNPKTNPKE